MEENGTEKKRNYERYLEGEVWNPQNVQSGYSGSDAAIDGQENTGYTAYQEPVQAPPDNQQMGYNQGGYPAGGEAVQFGSNPGHTGPSQVQNFAGLEEPVSMGEWVVSLLLTMIPCVGIIMMFIWAFGKNEKKSKANFFRAELIFVGVLLAFYFVFAFIMAVSFTALSS